MPVAFDCACGRRWYSPPDVGCASCGPTAVAVPDPVIWDVGQVPGHALAISGQMRDAARFARLVDQGFRLFVDIAGARPYVWRPDAAAVARAGVRYVVVEGVEDLNVDLPDRAFDAVMDALDAAPGEQALVFCAAGLKRSPHLVYGVLRGRGHGRDEAWRAVLAARPFVDPWPPYLAAAERWAAARAERLPSPA